MKKTLLLTAALAVAALILLIAACDKDKAAPKGGSGKGVSAKLLERMASGDDTLKFEYDDKRRLVKMSKAAIINAEIPDEIVTFTYSGNDLVSIRKIQYSDDIVKFERKGNVVAVSREGGVDTITLNEDGFITSIMPQDAPSGQGFEIVDGNVTMAAIEDGSSRYKYDNKKSPFNCNTPKWVLDYVLGGTYSSKNNIIEEKIRETWTESEYSLIFTYEYDSDGFPTKRTDADGKITTYTYTAASAPASPEQQSEKPQSADNADNTGSAVPKIVRNVEFGGATIPITGFCPPGKDEDANIIDSLSFTYSGTKHTIRLPERGEEEGPWYFDVSVKDYNFDDYMDIAILFMRGTANQLDAIYLYDPQTKSYSYNKELSGIMSVVVDKETKTLKSHMRGGHAGMLYEYSEYKWEKGKLTLVKSENQDIDNATELYIRVTKTLQNGKMVQTTDTIYSAYDAETLIDARDGQKYRTTKIGERTWMSQNLNFKINDSWCYDNNESNCAKYGRLYTWMAAAKACPEGWRLPVQEDWMNLIKAAGGEIAGAKLKSRSPVWNGVDHLGFSGVPGGIYSTRSGFYNIGSDGFWWSATGAGAGSDDVWFYHLNAERDNMSFEVTAMDGGLAARCVK